MVRAKVQAASISIMDIERIARKCKGEFFGTIAQCTIQFGFASITHARLFQKRLDREFHGYYYVELFT